MKRFIDAMVSLVLILLLLPLFGILGVLIAATLGRPLFFVQVRPGRFGKPFRMIKFRSMADERGPDGELLPDEQRIGRLGHFLRTSSLDELPELLNVLKGEMSLVGPRPLLMQYLPLYTPEQARRHEVRPGITGWAQVKGRNSLSWHQKFALDVWYVDHRTFLLDLKILFLTVQKVFRREGISQEGHATMPFFQGADD